MNFDLGDLRAFVAVAKLGSFRAAAAELHLSQPALSRRIEKLEGALGVRLFDRTTRKVDLTTVGRVQTPTLSVVVEREEKIRNSFSCALFPARHSEDVPRALPPDLAPHH